MKILLRLMLCPASVAAAASRNAWPPVMTLAALLGILLFLAVAIWAVTRPRGDFVIHVRGERVRFRGQFPAMHQGDAGQLVQQVVQGGRCTIYGTWGKPRVLRVRFRGSLSKAQQQRIRNFLIMTLGA